MASIGKMRDYKDTIEGITSALWWSGTTNICTTAWDHNDFNAGYLNGNHYDRSYRFQPSTHGGSSSKESCPYIIFEGVSSYNDHNLFELLTSSLDFRDISIILNEHVL